MVFVALCLRAAAGFLGAHLAVGASNPEPPVVRVAMSQAHYAGVNQNDAHAAMKAYFKTLAEDSGLAVEVAQLPMPDAHAVADAVRHGRADFLVMTTEEFLAAEDLGLEGPLLLSMVKKEIAEEYVLLTHAESALRSVRDLKGRNLMLGSDVRASLARRWLEVLCREHDLGAPEQALHRITAATKATLVVLPVFFRQADACILTRHGFDVMAELNPQLKKQLRVLAVSQPVVPSVSCFRRGFPEPLKERVIAATIDSHGRRAFEQVMLLFKTDGISPHPVSVLDSARQLLAASVRRSASANGLPVETSAAGSARRGGGN